MKDSRPVFLDLLKIRLPIAALVSILHRVSGAFLFVASFYLLFLLAKSLGGSVEFEQLKLILATPVHAFILWVTLCLLSYHFLAGLRHLLMDLHFGESLRASRIGATVVIVATLVASVLSGVWIWL